MANTNHLDFCDLFSDFDSDFTRSVGTDDLEARFSEVLITSAIAKCLDFNKSAQENGLSMPSFYLVSNVCAMCEELIYCSLFRCIGQQNADELAKNLNRLAFLRNVHTQTKFFALNNQLQPTLGGSADSTKLEDNKNQALMAVNDVWERLGLGSHVPSIQKLSRKVGLQTTYDYTYYLTSNFVHFNPTQLLRTGWGPTAGPFSFCVDNFERYFSNLARFLGALVFFGYCHVASDKFKPDAAKRYADTIAIRLQGNFRWPEITTYEEMNQNWPDSVIARSLMTVMRKDDPNAMPDVLSELQQLASFSLVS